MNGLFRHNSIFAAIAGAAALVLSLLFLLHGERQLAAVQAVLTAALLAAFVIVRAVCRKKYSKTLSHLAKKLNFADKAALEAFPLPCLLCGGGGEILWLSDELASLLPDGGASGNAADYLGGVQLEAAAAAGETEINLNGRSFSVFSAAYDENGEKRTLLIYVDFTSLRETRRLFESSRPYAILIEPDSVSDSRYDFRDSERAEINGLIEKELENWISGYSCLLKKISDNRYLIIAEKQDVDRMIFEKFSILDRVRELKYRELPISATLSIGVSGGSGFDKCENGARKALDMALSRGGDQAAVAVEDGYNFFGGVSKSLEKSEKVKSRVVSTALGDCIRASSRVFVMGHRFPDFDVMGAAVGVVCAARAAGVPCSIVTDREKSLAGPVIAKLDGDEELSDIITDEQTALRLADKKTLLVVVDTHVNGFVEFPALVQKAQSVFVIDHHRKSLDYIDPAEVFHLDPNASSASEMVTEMLQYFDPEPVVSKTAAEALLAGIMLDTKNFVLRSGARTFEAAAFLKRCGADTVSVKKLFSNSIDDNILRNKIVSSAKIYNACAVSICGAEKGDVRVISSQAADELLNVTGVKASFVLYKSGGAVNISARSFGEINVQLIMEALGGGGHLTMAACSLKDETFEHAAERLLEAINASPASGTKG